MLGSDARHWLEGWWRWCPVQVSYRALGMQAGLRGSREGQTRPLLDGAKTASLKGYPKTPQALLRLHAISTLPTGKARWHIGLPVSCLERGGNRRDEAATTDTACNWMRPLLQPTLSTTLSPATGCISAVVWTRGRTGLWTEDGCKSGPGQPRMGHGTMKKREGASNPLC